MTRALRRHAQAPIERSAQNVLEALKQASVSIDHNTAIALFVLGLEHLEPTHTTERLQKFFENVLAQPSALDPREDTRGT